MEFLTFYCDATGEERWAQMPTKGVPRGWHLASFNRRFFFKPAPWAASQEVEVLPLRKAMACWEAIREQKAPKKIRVPRKGYSQEVYTSWDFIPTQVGFNFSLVERPSAQQFLPPRPLPQARPAAIKIAGVMCPPLGRMAWKPYIRKEGEKRGAWRQRVAGMVAAIHLAKKMQSEEHWLQVVDPAEQLCRIVRSIGDRNPYDVLSDYNVVEKSFVPYVEVGQQRKGVPIGPRNNPAYEFIEHRLKVKQRLYELQQEWKEARFLRKEKMERVLLRLGNHQVISLKAALLEAALKDARKNFFSREATAQMDVKGADAQGDDKAKIDKKSNVEIQQQPGKSVGSSLPATKKDSSFKKLSAPKSEISDKTLHDRWFTAWSLLWKSDQSEGFELFSKVLPRDLLQLPNFRKSPGGAMFARHAYWRGDMEVKIIANTNVRQYGQLQFCFYYGDIADAKYSELRTNIWSASQRTHSLLTANFSNEIILKIPFEYIFPVMAIMRDSSVESGDLGVLKGRVIVPLTAADTCPKIANLKILIRFINNEFSGMVGTAIASAQMMPALATIVAAKLLADKNRDRPTLISPGMPVIPINSSSWCAGTGQSEFSNVLRLNPNCMLPYPEGRTPALDEMTVDYVKKIFGMVGIITWTADMTEEQKLGAMDAVPLEKLSSYQKISVSGKDSYQVPPVGVLASMFAYWRGSLELKIDIVGATEISGSLLIAYIPRVDSGAKITMKDAITCAHSIFDIHENRQIVFKIPYVASHMFWPRRTTLSRDYPVYDPPGAVFVFVYNKLIHNCTIPGSAKLVCYIRGGSDFEVSVPCCPSLASAFNNNVILTKDYQAKFVSKAGAYKYTYAGTWYRFKWDIKKDSDLYKFPADALKLADSQRLGHDISFSMPVLRYGAVSDHVKQFEPHGIKSDQDMQPWLCRVDPTPEKAEQTITFTTEGGFVDKRALRYDHGIIIRMDESSTPYYYCIPLTNRMHSILSRPEMQYMFKKTGTSYQSTNEWIATWLVVYQVAQNISMLLINSVVTESSASYWVPMDIALVPTALSGQAGDERSSVDAPIASPQDTAKENAAKIVFGEQFLDLKDYCRRYHLYASDTLNFTQLKRIDNWRTFLIKFPVCPIGLDLDLGTADKPKEYWNRTREGPIPLVASGYRFFTGGIRFRVCINVSSSTDADIKGKIFVQHRPNIVNSERKVQIGYGESLGTDDLELPGYATYHQFDDLNNVLSIEVPFYLPSIRAYLQPPTGGPLASKFSNLGEITIGVTTFSHNYIKIDYDIYYALADDARFSVFCGFPPMFSITDIETVAPPVTARVIEVEESDESEFDNLSLPSSSVSKRSSVVQRLFGTPDGQMLSAAKSLWSGSDKVEKVINQADELTNPEFVSDVKETVSNAKSITQTLKDNISNFIPTFESLNEKFHKYVNLVINVVTNLIHCVLNFRLATVVTALISFFVQLKLVCFSVTGTIVDRLSNLFGMLARVNPDEPLVGDVDISPTGQMAGMEEIEKDQEKENDSIICSYISTLVAGVAALFSLVPKFAKSTYSELSQLLLTGLGKFTFTANHLFTFVKNNLIAVKRIGEYLFSDHPSVRALGALKHNEMVYNWATKVQEVTDPRTERKVFTSFKLASEVYMLAAQGQILQVKMLELKLPSSETIILNTLIKKIEDLRNRLAKAHIAPPVRFEPYVFELTGPTGVGKSELFKILPQRLFKFMDWSWEGELNYYRALGNQYWNNLHNQPVCTIDEKFPISSPEFAGIQLAELFQLKSSCIFNPLMADIPDKNLRYNPLIVQYGSNVPFPVLPGVLDAEAVYRRRDALWRVDLNEKLKNIGRKKYSDLTNNEKGTQGKFQFLTFRKHKNPSEAVDDITHWGEPLNFEAFLNQLCNEFRCFYKTELEKFNSSLTELNSLVADKAEKQEIDKIMDFDWAELATNAGTIGDVDQVRKVKEQYNKIFYQEHKTMTWMDSMRLKSLKMQAAMYEIFNPKSPNLLAIHEEIIRNTLVYGAAEAQMGVENLTPKEIAKQADAVRAKVKYIECVCVHEAFESVAVTSSDLDYDSEQEALIFPLTNIHCKDLLQYTDFPTMKPGQYHTSDVAEYFRDKLNTGACIYYDKLPSLEAKTKIVHFGVKFQSCGDKCILKNIFEMKQYLRRLWMNKPIVRDALLSGDCVEKLLPPFFLESLTPPKKIDTPAEKEQELSTLRKWLSTLKEKFYHVSWIKWLKRLAIVIAVISFVGLIVGAWKCAVGGSSTLMTTSGFCATTGSALASNSSKLELNEGLINDIFNGNGHVSGDYKVNRISKAKSTAAVKAVIGLRPEGNAKSGLLNEQAVKGALRRNTFFLLVQDGVTYNIGRCLGIAGHTALITAHFWEAWNFYAKRLGLDNISFCSAIDGRLSVVDLKLSQIKFFEIKDSALAMIQLPKRIPVFKDIRKFIPIRAMHSNLNMTGCMAEMILQRGSEVMGFDYTHVEFSKFNNIKVKEAKEWKGFEIFHGYDYLGFSGSGKCGSILLANAVQTPICAVHVAGYDQDGCGLSELIYREMFDFIDEPDIIEPSGQGLQSNFFVDSEVIGIGKVPKQYAHQERGKSRIIASMVQHSKEFEVYAYPSVLSGQDPRLDVSFSPMIEGVKFHGCPLKPIDSDDLAIAVADYTGLVLANCKPCRRPGLLTVDEAIGGFEGKPGYEHLEFNTSEGYPFVGWRPKGKHDKRWLFKFNSDNKYESCNSLIRDVLDLKWKQRLNNKIPCTVFTDCLKDCTVDREKVLKPGKTRVFSMAPVDFTIQQRQCTLDFSVAFMECRQKLEHMVGCNPDSYEWTQFTTKLLSKGNNIITGDYSKFGDSIPVEFIHAAFSIISAWYRFNGCVDEELYQQLRIMPYEIGNSIHLMFDHLYQCVSGQPSGNSLTVIINSIANSLYLRCAWLSIMKNSPFNSLGEFKKHCSNFSYGDDLIASVTDEVKNLFNAKSLFIYFDSIDLKFTNADKSDEIVSYTSIENAEFLKRGFTQHPVRTFPSIILAPLGIKSIEDTPNWVWKDSFGRSNDDSATFKEMCVQVSQDSIRNAFGRGPEYYNYWSRRLQQFWLKKGVHLQFDTWDQMDSKIYDLGMDLSPYHKFKFSSNNIG